MSLVALAPGVALTTAALLATGLFPLGALGWSAAASVWGVQAVTLAMALCTGLAGLAVWHRLQAHDDEVARRQLSAA